MSAEVLDELAWRGLIADSTDPDALRAQLSAGPVTLYYGCDPSAPSLHIGNLIGLIVLRWFERSGHRPIGLAGGATGFIGDPGGRSSERNLLTVDEVEHNVERIQAQIARFIDIGEGKGRLVNNIEWTAGLSVIDFLRDIGKHFPVNVMLGKESVKARLESGGISYTEFSYMLLQSMDYLELFRRYDCRLQIGGSDQWGNLTSGIDLIRRVEGANVAALSWPLVTTATGEKFGKSTGGGSLWLDPELTSPYAMYQYWVNVDDADVGRYLRFFTFLPHEEIEALDQETAQRPAARTAARRLAEEVTTLVHGAEETAKAQAASRALFGQGELRDLDPSTLRAALAEAGLHEVDGSMPNVVNLLEVTGLCGSRSEARRTVEQGGAYLNNVKVSETDYVPNQADLLPGGFLVVRRGKRAVAGVSSPGSHA
ncbi:MAG TPA: tyrosine--tRNA ligase [Mycobacteriales bacterium]|nr:tyrosine--tRNA ligase [Mycobacteriales bacterium]